MATLPLRQWCQESRLLRDEFLDAQSAAQQFCAAVPNELSDQLLVTLFQIQDELEAIPIDQRLVNPLVKELRYLIGELDKLTPHVQFDNADWREALEAAGFVEMSDDQISQFNDQFPRFPLPDPIADRWLYWQKDNQVFVKTDHRLLLAETNLQGQRLAYTIVVFDLEPVISRNVFQDIVAIEEDPIGNTYNQTVATDSAFFRDPVPYSAMISEVVQFINQGGIARRRKYTDQPYRQKYWLKGTKDIMSAVRLPDTGNTGSLPGSLTLPYEISLTSESLD